MLAVEGVRKEYGGLLALDDVDLGIDRGEIVGLIGPNGAGKTTLFDVITGLTDPENGSRVEFDGTDLVPLEPHEIARLGLARTFQIVRVFGDMTVRDNAVAGALFGTGESISRTAAADRADDALAFLDLDDVADRPARSLPIARQKQIELARALAAHPHLILLDEIASGLTPAEIGRLSDSIRRLRDERGIAVFWIEHIMDAIMGTADRIVVLNGGREIATGPPEAIRNDPRIIEAYLGDGA